jgi:hypothetical protein
MRNVQRKLVYPAINIQAPWAELLLSGKKTVETRFYPLPKKYQGVEMLILETPGKAGRFKKRIVGIIKFGEPFKYVSATEFYQDSKRHLVTEEDKAVAWRAGKGRPKWGWPVLSVTRISLPLPTNVRCGIVFTKQISIVTQS